MIKCKIPKGRSPVPHVEANKYSPHKRNGWSVTLCMLLALLFPAFASAQITGTVYRDFDADGTQDALEPGVSGITVTAYDATNSSVSTTTTVADGTYTLTPGAGSFRIEVSDLPSYLQPGALGSDSETTVTFASDSDSGVDFAVNNPAQFYPTSEAEVEVASACMINGDQSTATDALVSLNYDKSGSKNIVSNALDIGTVWGLAWQRSTNIIFTSAMLKRHAGFGPGGIDAIYAITYDPSGGGAGAVAATIDLSVLGGSSVGANPRTIPLPSVISAQNHDPEVFEFIGKRGIGDIDISDDENTLYVMNLDAPSLVALDVSTPTSAAFISETPIPDPGCADGDYQPWAVKVHDGEVYVGITCTAETSQDRADLHAYVQRLSGGSFVSVFDAALDYPRSSLLEVTGAISLPAEWQPWISTWETNPPGSIKDTFFFSFVYYPQPFLSDIEWDTDGSLIMSIMDRWGHQVGYDNYQTNTADTDIYRGIIAGDILRVCNSNGTLELEGTGICPSNFTGARHHGTGTATADGGEFYQDNFDLDPSAATEGHDETHLGSLALLDGSGEVVAAAMDPGGQFDSGGWDWFNNTTGVNVDSFNVYQGFNDTNGAFGKAAGLGDTELLVAPAPIEIGNRLWFDSDDDGVQDPGELPVVGAVVELWADTDGDNIVDTKVAEITTDANGLYLFSFSGNANSPNTEDWSFFGGDNDRVEPNTAYEVRLPLSDPALSGLSLTQPDNGGVDPNADLRDSDAESTSNPGIATIALTTGSAGANNHTYDMGFSDDQTFDLALTKTNPTPTSVAPGGNVTFTINVFNQGTLDATLINVVDYLGSDLAYSSSNAASVVTTTNANAVVITDNADGTFVIDALAAGDDVSFTITLTVDANFMGTSLTNFAEISSAAGGTDIDSTPDNTNGNDAGGAVGTPSDDVTAGDGSGTPGDNVPGTDEDDHDPAPVTVNQTFDLALTKTNPTPTSVAPGGNVTFTINVFNQGTLNATAINIVDYLGSDLAYSSSNAASVVTTTNANAVVITDNADGTFVIDALAAGDDVSFTITLTVDAAFMGTTLTNFAEISSAVGGTDIDSTPDNTNGNDAGGAVGTPSDDVTAGDGSGTPGDNVPGTDEDDHDPAPVTVNQTFDLALTKTNPTPTSVAPGGNVTFTINVFNQGTLDATLINVVDYLGSDLAYSSSNAASVVTTTNANAVVITDNADGTFVIDALAAGDDVSFTITLTVDANFMGTSLTNFAEISSAAGGTDIDSTPDNTNGNDAGGAVGTPSDDVTAGDGSGTPGDNVPGTDEDDHDPAPVTVNQTFDLALTKTNPTPTSVAPGGNVTFTINVFNQGTLNATAINIVDYLGSGLAYSSSNAASVVTTTNANAVVITDNADGTFVIDALAAGDDVSFTITLTVDANFMGTTLTNFAEISSAAGGTDIDSTPDNTNGNDAGGAVDTPSDDVTAGDGTGTPGDNVPGTDEDDHDPEPVTVNQVFDLALTKTNPTPTSVAPGGNVTFTINVFNQGTLDATLINVVDYLGSDLAYSSSNAASVVTTTNANAVVITDNADGTFVIDALAAGDDVSFTITLTVDAAFMGTSLTNFAEISSAVGGTDIDSTPDNTNGNDAGGAVGTPSDDVTAGDGSGTPGDNVPGTDEDDHDPAPVTVNQTFDLALTKTNPTPTSVAPGGNVTFTINVFNQGTLDATLINVVDYLGSDLAYSSSNAASVVLTSNSNAVAITDNADGTFIIDALAAGDDVSFTITLTVDAAFMGTSLTNFAEISSAVGGTDIDSTPDNTNGNDAGGAVDTPSDDVTAGDGSGTPGDNVPGTDEDDHDPEPVAVNQTFDLALTKTNPTPTSVAPGGNVTFTINVFNQGTLDATLINIVDYLGSDLAYSSSNAASVVLTGNSNAVAVTDNADGTFVIDALAAGDDVSFTITLTVDAAFMGTTLTNFAEISSAAGGTDIDSTPDNTNGNDAGGAVDTPSDDVTAGDGSGTPGDNVPGTDEDDHDPEPVAVNQTFDLALFKTLASGQASAVAPGADVTFTISVVNQGTLDAYDIDVIDYIPTGLSLNDLDWTASGSNAVITIDGPLTPGDTTTVDITLTVDADFMGTSLTNFAEITDATDTDGGSTTPDVDSTPDGTDNNDTVGGDDVTDNTAGDEDDHDPAPINVNQTFDLALFKTLASGQASAVAPGADVTFTISVVNQGTLDAYDIDIIDYISTGLDLNDIDWTDNGATAAITIDGPLTPGDTTTVDITFTVEASFMGSTITNFAEIEDATDTDGGTTTPDVDSTPDGTDNNDAGGAVNTPADDETTGNGTGTIGDGVAGTDEDDHDPAPIGVNQTFDLALFKTLASGQASAVAPGADVTFTISVVNQGTLDAYDIDIIDYIPAGLDLNDIDWTDNGATAAITIDGPLTPGDTTTVDITFTVEASFMGSTITNFAEIEDATDTDGGTTTPDVDSTPDGTDNNDTVGGDDVTDNTAGDEDDHDPAPINVNQTFDLALFKTLANGQASAVAPGADVTFTISVVNQGTLDAYDIDIIDYIQTGLDLNDIDWTDNGATAAITIDGPLTPGDTTTVDITFTVEASFMGSTITNFAEIEDATDTDGGTTTPDVDSTPDGTDNNDAGGAVNTPADDETTGNGTGTIGDGVAGTDEDDHDPAPIGVNQTFDLALFKTLASGQASAVAPGADVTFTISVVNQGTLDAYDIDIIDYISTGLDLNDIDWTDNGATAAITIDGPLTPGDTTTVDITFTVEASFMGSTITNFAEIEDATDTDGGTTTPDVDSTPDGTDNNDAGGAVNTPADDETTGNGTGTIGDGVAGTDEDDHDPAPIGVNQTFDLALFKTLASGQASAVAPGADVTFTISVVNQGTLDAYDIDVIDYIPTGLSLNDLDWTASGSNAVITIDGPLTPGDTTTVDITLTVDAGFMGTSLTNFAEITDATDTDGGSTTPDVDSTPDGTDNNDTVGGDDVTDNTAGDEDDHDPAPINVNQTFDLALFKTLANGQASAVAPGADVTFTISVVNQGTLDAYDIDVIDYIPTGLSLNDLDWTASGSNAVITIDGPLTPGDTTTVDITFTVEASFMGSTITNFAEIEDATDTDGGTTTPDVDSTPDGTDNNDAGRRS